MIAAVGIVLMGVGDDLDDGGPTMSMSADPVDPANDRCCQRVRIHHETGDMVALEHLEIRVTFSDHDKRARFHDLPTAVVDQGDYSGHHVFSLGDVGIGGVADADNGASTFGAGDYIEFRIEPKRVDLTAGETVTVAVFNATSGTELARVDAIVRND
jgi:hypothetical protein